MAEFSIHTKLRPETGVAEVPVWFDGKEVTKGVLLTDGIFTYEIMDADLIALLNTGKAHPTLSTHKGHYYANILVHSHRS